MNEKGLTLLAGLLLAGTGIVVATSLVGLILGQAREVRRLQVIADSRALSSDVSQVLSSSTNCTWNLQTPPFAIDDSQVGTATYEVPVHEIIEPGPPHRPILTTLNHLTGTLSTVRVDRIAVTNLRRVNTNEYLGDLRFAGSSTNLGTFNRTLVRDILIQTQAAPVNAKTVTSCVASGGGGSTSFAGCHRVQVVATVPGANVAYCPPGERLIGGGGGCRSTLATFWWTHPDDSQLGYVVSSHPTQNLTQFGWLFECFGKAATNNVLSDAEAHCCPP